MLARYAAGLGSLRVPDASHAACHGARSLSGAEEAPPLELFPRRQMRAWRGGGLMACDGRLTRANVIAPCVPRIRGRRWLAVPRAGGVAVGRSVVRVDRHATAVSVGDSTHVDVQSRRLD